MLKRLLDIVGSLFGILVTLPVWATAAVWIKLDSPGPVFYRGWRVGRGGKPFRMFKFRTMVADAERTGVSSTSDQDSRITRSGRWLRKYKIDELPQLWNVLRGEMSLVGPRPEVPKYVELFTEEERAILTVRPGITDWASLWNADEGAVLAGADDPDRAYELWIRPTKLRLQLEYVRRHNVWIDVKIIIYTIVKVFRKNWLPRELASYGRPEASKQRMAALRGSGFSLSTIAAKESLEKPSGGSLDGTVSTGAAMSEGGRNGPVGPYVSDDAADSAV